MPETNFSRSEMLLGTAAMARIAAASVAVFGLGGVGSFAVEALARCGVGRLALFDHDVVSPSNLNRQLVALHSTLGRRKVEVMAERIKDINPAAEVAAYPVFYKSENADMYPLGAYDYVVDAVDTVSAKLLLIHRARSTGVPVLSCMGTGNKLDPARFEIADIEKTSVCPLARVMRRELKKLGIRHVKVLFSSEPPISPGPPAAGTEDSAAGRRQTPGSVSFVPPVAGLMIAGEVVRELLRGPAPA